MKDNTHIQSIDGHNFKVTKTVAGITFLSKRQKMHTISISFNKATTAIH